MAFNQFMLDVASEQTRGIFNKYVYKTTDDVATVSSAGYFKESRFNDLTPNNWINGWIDVEAADGNVVMVVNSTGDSASVIGDGGSTGPIEVLVGRDTSDQTPVSLDTPIQITFGPAQGAGADPVSLDVSGTATFNEAGRYRVDGTFSFARTTTPGVVFLYIRGLLDGIQVGAPIGFVASDDDQTVPVQLSLESDITTGQTFSIEMYADSAGSLNGGLQSNLSTLWGAAPSAILRVTKL